MYPLIIILVVEYQKSSQSSAPDSSILPETIQFASAPIISHLQDLSGQDNISIIQLIADHIETSHETPDEKSTRSKPEDPSAKDHESVFQVKIDM